MRSAALLRNRRWAAVLAAYLLVVQAVFAGFAAGQAAAWPELAHQILCAPSSSAGTGAGGPGPVGDPAAHLSGCCSLGCLMSGFPLAPGPAATPAPAPRLVALSTPYQDMRFAAQRPARWVVGHPRGPPAVPFSAA